jgi:hypothetical protein
MVGCLGTRGAFAVDLRTSLDISTDVRLIANGAQVKAAVSLQEMTLP